MRQTSRPDKKPGYQQVRIEPSSRFNPGVFILVNDHFQDNSDSALGATKVVSIFSSIGVTPRPSLIMFSIQSPRNYELRFRGRVDTSRQSDQGEELVAQTRELLPERVRRAFSGDVQSTDARRFRRTQ